jgi:hypothetical protein
MNKIIALIVLLAVIWAVPPVRNRVITAAMPVLEMLGPVGEFAINPMRRHAAKSKATHLHRVMSGDRDAGRAMPEEQQFHEWVRRRIPEEDGLDPWGNPFWIQFRLGALTVGSSGADGTRGNDDDVTHTAPF